MPDCCQKKNTKDRIPNFNKQQKEKGKEKKFKRL